MSDRAANDRPPLCRAWFCRRSATVAVVGNGWRTEMCAEHSEAASRAGRTGVSFVPIGPNSGGES